MITNVRCICGSRVRITGVGRKNGRRCTCDAQVWVSWPDGGIPRPVVRIEEDGLAERKQAGKRVMLRRPLKAFFIRRSEDGV